MATKRKATTTKATTTKAAAKSSKEKAFEAAAEIAPLVQTHQSNGGTEVNSKEAQKAAEFLMDSMATKEGEHVVINGITIPTQAELLEMPEEDYMNERQLAFFLHLLRQREAQLRQNADQTTENLRETTVAPDPLDRATIEEEHALELRTRDRERKLLKKVQDAIKRIEKGDFGWCEETGEPIGIPRLLARPTATLSLEAQQRRELRQKLYGD